MSKAALKGKTAPATRRRPVGLFRDRRGWADPDEPAWLAAGSQGVQGFGIAGSAGGLGSIEATWVEHRSVPGRAGCRSRGSPQPRNPPSSTLGLGERRGMSRLAQHLVYVPGMQFFQLDHLASVFFQRDGAMFHQCQELTVQLQGARLCFQ